MLRNIKVGKNNRSSTNDMLPVKGSDGRYVKSSLEPSVDRDIFLATVYSKLNTLKDGESDPKKKAKLFEIATNNLSCYFQKGGTLDAQVKITVTNAKTRKQETVIVNARELQQELAAYQK